MEQPSIGAKRIAFFGGSFDPPHAGHLAVARAAVAALSLDRVLFAPVGAQPLKPLGPTASFDDRVAMTRLAIDGDQHFELSLLDAPKARSAPNYTLETLLDLRREIPDGGALFFLMGADSFLTLRRWHRAAEIPFIARLIVASRPGQPLDDLRSALPHGVVMDSASDAIPIAGGGIVDRPRADISEVQLRSCQLRDRAGLFSTLYLLQGLHVDISASEIRREIAIELSEESPAIDDLSGRLLPAAVFRYIQTHALYR